MSEELKTPLGVTADTIENMSVVRINGNIVAEFQYACVAANVAKRIRSEVKIDLLPVSSDGQQIYPGMIVYTCDEHDVVKYTVLSVHCKDADFNISIVRDFDHGQIDICSSDVCVSRAAAIKIHNERSIKFEEQIDDAIGKPTPSCRHGISLDKPCQKCRIPYNEPKKSRLA